MSSKSFSTSLGFSDWLIADHDALHALDDVEDLFEAILGEGISAMNTEIGWVGSLTHFTGGKGYWIIVEVYFIIDSIGGKVSMLTSPLFVHY